MNDRPQYLTALSDARRYANQHQVTVIVYHDEDSDNPEIMHFVSEAVWDIWCYNGQVEADWAFGEIFPA